jgi:hypothetical protein
VTVNASTHYTNQSAFKDFLSLEGEDKGEGERQLSCPLTLTLSREGRENFH